MHSRQQPGETTARAVTVLREAGTDDAARLADQFSGNKWKQPGIMDRRGSKAPRGNK